MDIITSIGQIIGVLIIAFIVCLWLPGIQRKYVHARIQQRLGPNVTSPGIFATTKFFFKESLKPNAVMPRLYNMLPLFTILVVAVLYILLTPNAMVTMGVYSSVIGLVGLLKLEEVMYLFMGSFSQSIMSVPIPFPDQVKGGAHIDASRSFLEQISANRSLKLISYGSLPLYIAIFIPAIMTGSLYYLDIVSFQQYIHGPILFSVPGVLGAIAFFIGLLILLNEYPFSFMKGKSDVVEGPIFEYMSKSRAFYFVAHAFLIFVGACVFSTLFLGYPPVWGWAMIVPVICSIIIAMAAAAVSAFSPLFTNREFYPTVIATFMISIVGVVLAFFL